METRNKNTILTTIFRPHTLRYRHNIDIICHLNLVRYCWVAYRATLVVDFRRTLLSFLPPVCAKIFVVCNSVHYVPITVVRSSSRRLLLKHGQANSFHLCFRGFFSVSTCNLRSGLVVVRSHAAWHGSRRDRLPPMPRLLGSHGSSWRSCALLRSLGSIRAPQRPQR